MKKSIALLLLLPVVIIFCTGISTPPTAKPNIEAQVAQVEPEEVSYGEVLRWSNKKKIESLTLDTLSFSGKVELKNGRKATFSYIPGQTSFIDEVAKSGADVKVEESSRGGGSFFASAPFALFIVMLVMLSIFIFGRRARGKAKGAKAQQEEVGKANSVSGFSVVAGLEEAVEEVSEFSEYLKHPEPFHRVGARMPKGILLYGPPGTGKTLLAKALAAEAGVPFFAASGTDFVEKYVGVGASRVRDLFSKASQCDNGAVIFIDEIDAIGRKRSGEGEQSNEEREGTLNEILVQLDGFTERSKVLVVGATNRLDILDEALLRPGRLSRQIYIAPPDEAARLQILSLYAQDKPLQKDVSLKRLARITAGSSGADLEEMLNEAAIMAARAGNADISEKDLWEGHLRVLAGPERSTSPSSSEEQKVIAYHEAGHVLVAELCPEHEKAERATIRPRAQAAGMAIYGQRDKALHSESYLREQLLCILGGRAAEKIAFGRVSSGAANDLQRASALARRAVEELGLSPSVGQAAAHGKRDSEDRLGKIDDEVANLVDGAYEEACRLLREHKEKLKSLADKLLEAEDISRLEIEEALGKTGHETQINDNWHNEQPPRPRETKEVEQKDWKKPKPSLSREVLQRASSAWKKRKAKRAQAYFK